MAPTPKFRCVLTVCLVAFPSLPITGQDAGPAEQGPRGSPFWIPASGLLVPGLGQFLLEQPATALVYGSVAVGGFLLGQVGDPGVFPIEELPRGARDQLAFEGLHLAATAGAISAWDAFHDLVPELQSRDRYRFLDRTELDVTDLLTAPFDPRFLGRWTTLVELAYTAAVTTLVLSSRSQDAEYEPFRGRDGLFVAALSFNAGVGEEAVFRGWLLPFFHESFNKRFWLANAAQAGIFGGLHAPQAGVFAIAIAGWAAYEGWLTRRNNWSVRESIFHHFWYDVAVAAATLLVDERDAVLRLRVPAIRF